MSKYCAIILAGGQGKRMHSPLPKPMLKVLGVPMIDWVISSCENVDINDICIVTGFANKVLESHLEGKYHTVFQRERLGTGHAVIQCIPYLVDILKNDEGENTIILFGDAPFIDEEIIEQSLEYHSKNDNSVTVLSAVTSDNFGYGRIIRDEKGVKAIVEEKDCTKEQKAITEINSGVFCFKTAHLLEALKEITPANAQGEYYLTDTVEILLKKGYKVDAFIGEKENFYIGANDRKGMQTLNEIARMKEIEKHLEKGVSINFTDGVIIEKNVKIGTGTEILTGAILKGNTTVGENSTIGHNCILENTVVGNNTTLNAVQSYDSYIGSNVKIGPFVQLRPNSVIKDGVKIGDFVEVKNSVIDENTAVAHLTYVGDSDVGKRVNFGCGVVTVNYDGKNKHRTTILDDAFIGCNTNLIAPVTVGEGAYTAAGTTITKNVPDHALAIERAELKVKENFARKKLKK